MVKVKLAGKGGRYSNHRPEFRPTDTDKLFGAERLIGQAVEQVMDRRVDVDGFAHGRISKPAFRAQLLERALDDDLHRLRVAIYSAYMLGASDNAAQIRSDVNNALGSRSPARLVPGNYVGKAETIAPVWDVTLDSFDVVDPKAPGSVYARFEAGEVLAGMAADTEAAIGKIVEDGFTASRTWATGRTSHGLTPDDISRSLFAVLNDERQGLTGASYASELGDATRGLHPRWATAVETTGNNVSYAAMRAGATPAQALAKAEAAMERHGTKLRRARAKAIARTETARAQNEAIADGNRRAVDQGLVGPDTEMEWITGPFDVCPICTPLGGTRQPIKGGSFPTQSGLPPAHPSCRCKTRLVPDLGGSPERIGEGSREDPFRYRFADGWVAPINPRRVV
jgi:hypothetical protein